MDECIRQDVTDAYVWSNVVSSKIERLVSENLVLEEHAKSLELQIREAHKSVSKLIHHMDEEGNWDESEGRQLLREEIVPAVRKLANALDWVEIEY